MNVLSKVDACTWEPLGTWHRARAENSGVGCVRDDLEVIPNLLPEVFEVRYRPGPGLVIVLKMNAIGVLNLLEETTHLGGVPLIAWKCWAKLSS